MNKFFVVVQREFIRALKSRTFWFLTLGIPLIYIVIFSITYYSNSQANEQIEIKTENLHNIYVFDESGLIKENFGNSNIIFVKTQKEGKIGLFSGNNNLFIHYPLNFVSSKEIDLSVNDGSLTNSYTSFLQKFTLDNLANNIQQKDILQFFTTDPNIVITHYKDGKAQTLFNSNMLVMIVGIIAYFFMMIMGASRMLTSMVEEKESRMIEIILSSVHSRIFVAGKIVGSFLLLLFQLFLVVILPLIVILNINTHLGTILLETLHETSISDWLWMIFYILIGFLTLSGLMIASGTAGSNQKEANSFSSVFIILAILPLYFAAMLFTSPKGTLALILSYTPITSPLILLFRSNMGELYLIEYFIGPICCILYMLLSFYFASKMFSKGALEFNKKLSFKDFFNKKQKI